MEVREPSANFAVSDAEETPGGWSFTQLASIASVTSGKRLPLGRALSEHPTPHPYIRVTDMRDGSIDVADVRYVPSDVFPRIKHYRIFKEDIYISVAGTLGLVGKVPAELDGANLTENADRIWNIQCSRDYLLHWLGSERIQSLIARSQTVGAQPKLALERIRAFPVAFPSDPAEQEEVAGALSDANALIDSLERLLVKKRQIKQGAMQELLTGRRRLPGFSGAWTERQLGELITYCGSGGTPYRGNSRNFEGNIKWITSGELNYNVICDTAEHISDEALQTSNLRVHPIGTFLMAITGACGIVGAPATTNQSCMAVYVGPDLSNAYLFHYYVLRGKELALRYCQGTKQQSYTAGLVRLLPIALPPSVAEQTAIATVLSDLDAELSALEARLAKARLLKQGMMQALLTGRIRLV
jgi:type I restriction enzyme S subunit